MLKQLILANKRKGITLLLDKVRADIEALTTREAELAQAIEEVTTDEEREVVTAEVESFEKEKTEKESSKAELERQLEAIDSELEEIEKNKPEPAKEERTTTTKREERGHMNELIKGGKFFRGMARTEVDGLLERDDMKTFLANVRTMTGQTRAVTGAELLIPEAVLPIIKAKIEGYSKLMKHVNYISVKGEARVRIAGVVSEAVWTEACAKLNELSFGLNRVDIDGYKVGGYIDVCTAILEDSDFNLADYILNGISQAIGLGIDKAILYGTDVKMPMGIVTRLAQTTKPSDYSVIAPAWVDLSATNIKKTTAGKTGADLYSEVMGFVAAAKGKFATTGTKFWAMNESTLLALKQALLTFNASGALTADVSNVMPLIGGAIETLEFIPDGDIIGGYGELYALVERHGIKLASSDIPRWYEDETSFKGTGRYDGMPVIAEGFVAFNIKATDVTKTVTFPQGEANAVTP